MKILRILAVCLVLIPLFSCNNDGTMNTEESTHPMNDGTMKMENNDMMSSMEGMKSDMEKMKMTGDFDHDFAAMMISHHQGAIDMSEAILKSGKDEKIKNMAENAIKMQKAEQVKFQDFLGQHKGAASAPAENHNELMENMQSMMQQMGAMKMTGNPDKDFAAMMIAHHEGAIKMSENEIAHGKVLEMKQMAQQIMNDQTTEIQELKDWLAK